MNIALLSQWGRSLGFGIVALGVYISLLHGANWTVETTSALGRAGVIHSAWVFPAILGSIVTVFAGLWVAVMLGKLCFGHPIEYEDIEIDPHIELTPSQDRRLMHGYVLLMVLIMMPTVLYSIRAWEKFVLSDTGSQHLYEVVKHVGFPVAMVISMMVSMLLIQFLMIHYRRWLAMR